MLQQLYAQVMLGIQNWFWDIEQSPSSHGKGIPCNNKLEIAACSSRLGQRDHAKSEKKTSFDCSMVPLLFKLFFIAIYLSLSF